MNIARLLVPALLAAVALTGCDSTSTPSHDQAVAALEATVPGDYATIQAALDGASSGDVIVLAAQSYPESFALVSGVTVRGAGPGQTIIYGTVTASSTSGAALESLTLSGVLAGPGAVGLDSSASNVSVSEVTISGYASHGVRLLDSSGSPPSLDRVTITGCDGSGVHIDGAAGASVSNTVITFNGGHGVRVVDALSPAPTVTHSLIFANGHGTQDAGVTIEKGTGLVVNTIITGNHVGVDCLWSGCTTHHNVVWGNGLDYVNWAKPGTGDVRKDPALAGAAEGDYHPAADSPALDAGAAGVGPAHDFEANLRPQGSGPDIGPFERAVSDGFDSTVIINEIMANALDEGTGEYIELYNPSLGDVDVAGWVIDDGDATDALVGWQGGTTVIPPLSYAVILDTQYPGTPYDIPAEAVLLTVGNAKIGSGLSNSDPITLSTPGGVAVVDTFSHPFDAGNGVSVEKDTAEDGDIATNWVASPCGRTPGSMNCASGLDIGGVAVAINEVMANPLDEGTGEFIELLNIGNGSIDLAGHVISDGDSTDELTGWAGGPTVLAPGQFAVVLDPDQAGDNQTGDAYVIGPDAVRLTITSSTTLGNALSNNDPISLSAPDGTTLDQFEQPFNAGNGLSMERVDPEGSSWVASTCASGSSPGETNCASVETTPGGGGPTTILITEVMANPLVEDTGEFVELYNHGDEPVDLAGWWIDDGDNDETLEAYEGGTTVVEAGGFAVVLDSEYASDYAIAAGTVLLTTPNTTIASGLGLSDPISVRAPSAVEPVSTFGFPFNPGNGFSAQRVDLAAADVPSNWISSPCGASPGTLTCDEEEPPPPTDATLSIAGLVISEVLANPLDESVGEMVELYNAGPAAIDLAGLQLSDGDSIDELEAFEPGGDTVLGPGAFAVVLDQQYELSSPLGTALLLTVDDLSLGNGLSTNDPISILDPSNGAALATFSFPSNPGNGRSIERVTAAAGDVAANWTASPCDSSAGLKNCADTSAEPTGARADGQPCPNGGADCDSGVCGVDTLAAVWRCVSDCAGGSGCATGFECLGTTDADHPEVCFGEPAEVPLVADLVINELVVDGPGYDVDVFVEIAGLPGTVVDGLQLVGVNGSSGDKYKAVTLAGQIGDDGFFVVAHPSAPQPTLGAADMLTIAVEYQNGPDSVHLLAADGSVIDAVGYGSFGDGDVFAGEGTAAPDQPPGLSLSRVVDQLDTDDNGVDFALADPTPGAANQLNTLPQPAIAEVLISEVRVSPSAAEFFELHNPGGSPVDLSWVYVADYPAYHQITTGGGAPTSADFRLRFPAGTEIAPGGYVTVSLESAAHFDSEYGLTPDFDLNESIQAAPAMEGEYTGSASLSNATEMLVVFYWDGASDLVTDLDYIAWGSTTQHMDKTGVVAGSSTYADETPPASQDTPKSPEDGALSRCLIGEGAEATSGGNGVGGDDETSEDFSETFQLLFPPTPGSMNICQSVCTPVCDGKTCGGDGCGGTCGACVEGQVCDEGDCITPAGSLPLSVVTGFDLPEAFHDVQAVQLITSAAEFQSTFGVPAPPSIAFPDEWALWYSEGKRNTPGHIATVLEVVDNTSELFVFTELHLPGEACEVLELTLPTWQLVRFPAPASGATTVEQIHGDFDFDCAANGAVNGANCDHDELCGADLICSGTTLNYGICFPSWMHKVFPVTTPAAIPDGDLNGVTSWVQIEGMATVEMDVVIKVDITHPDPSQLTLTMFNPYNCEGDPAQWVVFWDQVPTAGADLHLHQAVIGFSGDGYINGPWSLKIVDNVPGGAGTLDFWSAEMTSRWD